jgi:ABC-2 type transport system permease protein
MRKLLSIELTKLLNYTSFKVILGLHLALFSLVIFVTSQIDITVPGFDTANLFRFPHVWSYFAWVASWFNLLLAILIIMITGNEFTYRTFRQHVIDGLSRMDLLKGKLAVVFLIAVYCFLLVFISGIIYGLIFSAGFSTTYFFTNIDKLFIFFLQTLSYMVIGLLLVMFLRSTALSIIIFILVRFPVEPILRTFFDSAFRPFFPMKAVSGLTPMPEFLSISSENSFETLEGGNALSLSEMGIIAQGLPVYLQILVAMGYTAVFLGVIAYILKNRNL